MRESDDPISKRYRKKLNDLARYLDAELHPNGFALFMFDQSDPKRANYISNCNREDIIKVMEETIARWKGPKNDLN